MISTEYGVGLPPVKIAPYVAAKSALNAYALSLAQEWQGSNIRVHYGTWIIEVEFDEPYAGTVSRGID